MEMNIGIHDVRPVQGIFEWLVVERNNGFFQFVRCEERNQQTIHLHWFFPVSGIPEPA